MKRRIVSAVMLGVIALSMQAQSGTKSPYSQYGFGVLADQSQGFNRGMNGLALGMRSGTQVNMLNPASYAALDSLTFLFDMGLSGQITNFKEGGKQVNAKTANFEYAVAGFRAMRNLGVSFGFVPYSNIGYGYSSSSPNGTVTGYESHAGDGGFRQVYLGLGWQPLKGFSIGANASYLWGDYEKSIVSSSETGANVLTKMYSASISSYKLDFGAQFQQRLSKKDVVTLGATVGLGHKLGADAYVTTSNTNSGTGITTQGKDSVLNAFSIPMTLGFGVAYSHDNKLILGVDYTLQKWGELDYPQLSETTKKYESTSGLLSDRHKLTVGGEFVPNATNRKLLNRVHYRFGASYATPYYKVQGQDGPKELSVSAGFGIPITNSYNNRSLLNISAQWVHSSAQNFVTENTFRINIGLTFNERWFSKWKVD